MPELPMKLGVPLDEMSLLFFAAVGTAIWLVYVFCQRKFAERSFTRSGDFIYQLLPQQLATREEYSKGFLIYFGEMAAPGRIVVVARRKQPRAGRSPCLSNSAVSVCPSPSRSC